MSVDEGLKAFQYIFFYPNISFWLQAVENHYRDHIYIQNYIIFVVQTNSTYVSRYDAESRPGRHILGKVGMPTFLGKMCQAEAD